ncbi:UDP-N-acetylenolpyruvoylglucosamine reductase [Carboxydothermus islandicus]|uniref:UDP-N-acetylenolpyruvoylglucosamine reductase n=1 Tax=Carboxydothermus islandicus TaxID=661089 RepID=A0A1L8D3J8_9THEO|nr:UDP-N-acetylmuramate dehydrogenase [Carboxydothermus islandicus]GAV25748.1 UDP-N-acetylenolpyruvoylglucosamine reductase [Carboxydothermus islandicus]
MDKAKLKEELAKRISSPVLENEPLAQHTTWKIGGPADFLIEPQSIKELSLVIRFLTENAVNFRVIGNGSNILVLDKGFRGVIIKTKKINKVEINAGGQVFAEAGVMLPVLAARALKFGLSGLEELSAIPGSVGGAVRQNAGAHGKEIKDVVKRVWTINEKGELEEFSNNECGFKYRSSRFKEEEQWIVKAEFSLNPGDKKEILKKIREFREKRLASQPLEFPNAGSVFKNPEGIPAWKLIKEAGAQGLKKGGAMVSEKHANFIVNTGGASAADVIYLINKIQELVWKKFSVKLLLEVEVLGE